MRSAKINKLWDADTKLFESMRGNYQSESEKKFFEYLFDVEQWDFSMSGDLLLHENDNEDRLYIMRVDFDEYEVGKDSPNIARKPTCSKPCFCYGSEFEGVWFAQQGHYTHAVAEEA